LGDIGVPMSCDISQPQCHKCSKGQKNSCKWERRKSWFFVFLYTCDIVVGQCHPSVTLFWTYAKQLMQINKFLCIIHKFINVVYDKTVCEDAIFASENL